MVVLIVDGYNIIGDWDELKRLKQKDMSQARDRLIELMAEYQAYSGIRVIIVFDAYYVRGMENKLKQYKVEIIFTKEKETADECIERLVKKLKNVKTQVYVATSDYTEQRVTFGQGALRKSARELAIEINDLEHEITLNVAQHEKAKPKSKIPLTDDVLEKFEKWISGDI